MSDTWEALVRELSTQGPRRHASWDASLFETLVHDAAATLRSSLHAEPRRDAVVGAWLKLAAEAVGLGHVDRASARYLLTGQGRIPETVTLTGRCLLQLAPAQLPAYPAEKAVALLTRTWNLCEGLAAQPVWMNRYVASAAAEAPALEKLDEFLVTTLAPALAPSRTSAFSGPFTLAMLDTRKLMDEFLPGDMHLAAPSVLCVHDRRAEDMKLGVFLAPEGKARFLGLMPCLGTGHEETPPRLEVRPGAVRVNKRVATLPFLSTPHQTLVATSGYVVASAADSQRLWVLDTP
ncbi:hypothetical protein JY651_43185 [Pyxidicoccus parkwayensis]|uniref:Uncharacterized protein n=1 Tax=Pyxidicoccus parkwayensis TaxID=2813578 RepID=A0ABX7NSL8_9BACT|nr:hypothetical protein [Pyxidicoccus parkwaysis]QSQ21885.1 hypothetical protein JY651_43185 [Pyxidicoccus parkwaysis]